MTSGNSVSYTISEFLEENKKNFTGKLHESTNQTVAWDNQFDHLQQALKGRCGSIIFEYGIPGLAKVVDVIILLQDKVFVVEYKNGSDSFNSEDKDQALNYALRLRYFHSNTHDKIVIPVLIATEAEIEDENLPDSPNDDNVYDLILCNSKLFSKVLDKYAPAALDCSNNDTWDHEQWKNGIFKACPTIIETAKRMWNEKNVSNLTDTKNEDNKIQRLKAENTIIDIIKQSRKNGRKSLVFVTGVPGAGKTLVGLNISVEAQEYGASFLSGNDPLVEVISKALLRNIKDQYNSKDKQADSNDTSSNQQQNKKAIAVESIIRGVYGYKNEIIEKRLDYDPGDNHFKVKENSNVDDSHRQHVIIYDEAQRAWSVEKMRKPGRTKKDWQTPDWPFSEPSLLLWDIDKLDWGVVVCLVGGGQEINSGESGINEWLRTLIYDNDKITIDNWDVYLTKELSSDEYKLKDTLGNTVDNYLSKIEDKLNRRESLHLTECQRTPLATDLAKFINKLVEGKATESDYNKIKRQYPIKITRDIELAKKYLRKKQNNLSKMLDGHARAGMLMSSTAARLRPLGFEVKSVGNYLDKVANWFLDSKEENIESSDYLEVAMTEFLVQGLEIDLSCLIWDADFRYNPDKNNWEYYKFNKIKWSQKIEDTSKSKTDEKQKEKDQNNIKIQIVQRYMQNAYRVLLTRARFAMVICVPEGDINDPTRLPQFYDPTYNYLKALGFDELSNP